MQFDSSISSENAQLIKKTMDLYHKGFIEKNIDEIVTRFSYPTFLIFGNTHKSLDNEGTLRNFYSGLIDTLPQDYSYSKVVKSSVKLLDEQNSIVSNIFARYKKLLRGIESLDVKKEKVFIYNEDSLNIQNNVSLIVLLVHIL